MTLQSITGQGHCIRNTLRTFTPLQFHCKSCQYRMWVAIASRGCLADLCVRTLPLHLQPSSKYIMWILYLDSYVFPNKMYRGSHSPSFRLPISLVEKRYCNCCGVIHPACYRSNWSSYHQSYYIDTYIPEERNNQSRGRGVKAIHS